jgi:hypothetical protein
MVKEQQDFTVFSKNRIVLSVSVTDDDDVPVNLTSYPSIHWFMMNRPHSPTWSVSKSLGTGIAVVDAPNGVFTVDLSSSDLASMSGSFYHEALLVDANSQPYTIMIGTVKVRKSAFDR